MSVRIQRLSKSFGGEVALDGVDLEVGDGEIHALLGPNGSGKSTLIGCLSGRLTPDHGSMIVGGQEGVRRFTPRSAFAAGTAVIYQHFSLVPALSVSDNIFLGSERTRSGALIDRSYQLSESREILARLGVRFDPRVPVASLSSGEKQLVEIAKALRHRPQLLVLDEPTAALGEVEARLLGQQLRKLRDSGLAILYVSHLLSEVFEIADRVTVLRDGRRVLVSGIDQLSADEVIAAIAPQVAGGAAATERRRDHTLGSGNALELSGFAAPGIGPVDLSVAEGEIVAVFGLLGSGRTELVEGLYGIRGRTEGSVKLGGAPFVPKKATASIKRGLALVAGDRGRQSIFAQMSARDNLLLPHVKKLGRSLWRNRKAEAKQFDEAAELLRLRPRRPGSPAWTYSGGNQQKLVVGRWLSALGNVRFLMLDEPTQGIDIGARLDLYELVREFASRPGHGVLFTSSDPEEVQALADRAHVLARGELVAELSRNEITPERLLDLAHGARSGSERDETDDD